MAVNISAAQLNNEIRRYVLEVHTDDKGLFFYLVYVNSSDRLT